MNRKKVRKMLKSKTAKRVSVIVLITALCLCTCLPAFVFADKSDGDGEDQPKPSDWARGSIGHLSQAEKNMNTLNLLKYRGISTIKIGGKEIPLRAGGLDNTWALINLILSVLGLIGAFVMILTMNISSSKKSDKGRYIYQSFYSGDYLRDDDLYGGPDADEQPEQREPIAGQFGIALATATAVISILLFVFFEDPQTLMVLTDKLTLPTVIFFVAEVILIIVALMSNTDWHEHKETAYE